MSTTTDVRWSINGNVIPRSQVREAPLIYDVNISTIKDNPTGDWRNVEQHHHDYVDIDYTSSGSSLGAAWPQLHYPSMNYSVSVLRRFLPCGHMSAADCGSVVGTTLRLTNLSLYQARRYHICISSAAVIIQHETYNESLPAIEYCTDGVTVDTTPPTPGCAWAGPGSSARLDCTKTLPDVVQASTSELEVHWAHFSDVETNKAAIHVSGVNRYEIGVGECAHARTHAHKHTHTHTHTHTHMHTQK